MGNGMAEFLDKRVDSEKEWDKVSRLASQERLNSAENLRAGRGEILRFEFDTYATMVILRLRCLLCK